MIEATRQEPTNLNELDAVNPDGELLGSARIELRPVGAETVTDLSEDLGAARNLPLVEGLEFATRMLLVYSFHKLVDAHYQRVTVIVDQHPLSDE